MPQNPPSLPSPRIFLTTILSTLTENPASTRHPSPPSAQDQPSQPGNPLQDVSPEAKGLISTLHVLFPTLVLPALDLLDRGLVTRIFVQDASTRQSTDQAVEENQKRQEENTKPEIGGTYIVRSITSTMRRRAAESKYYLVLLTSWSCSCPAFTLDAFPPRTAAPPLDTPRFAGQLSDRDGRDSEWEFGGLSFDGLPPRGGNVPCCKHLLACVLAERWGSVLGTYAPERVVTKEEMAGMVAEL